MATIQSNVKAKHCCIQGSRKRPIRIQDTKEFPPQTAESPA